MTEETTNMEKNFGSVAPLLVSFVKPYRGLIAIAIICMGITASTTGLYAFITGPALKLLILPASLSQTSEHGIFLKLVRKIDSLSHIPFPLLLIFLLSSVALIRSSAQACETLLIAKTGQEIQMDIRHRVFEKLMRLDPMLLMKVRKGDLISRITSDINMMEIGLTHAIASIIRDGLQIIALGVVAFYLNPILSLSIIIVLPPVTLLTYTLNRKIRKAFKQAFEKRGLLASVFMELSRGLSVIKIFGAEKQMLERLTQTNMEVKKNMMKAISLSTLTLPIIELVASVTIAAIIFLFMYFPGSWCKKPETFISFCTTLILLFRPIKGLGSITSFFQQTLTAGRRISHIFSMKEESKRGNKIPPPLKYGITLKNVHFSFGDREIFSGINLFLPYGKITAIAGASGEGKTTLVNLICGFLHPSCGEILWDNIPYEEIETAAIRNKIAIVPQDSFLLNATIEENILLGSRNKNEENLKWAISAAGLDTLLEKLPSGLKTIVEEEASILSGGEKQKICIARALVHSRDLLIFDEATASLDSRSEDIIQQVLAKIKGGKTILILSHRLSTIKYADSIGVISGGKVVEYGKWSTLAKPGTEFYNLFASQILQEKNH